MSGFRRLLGVYRRALGPSSEEEDRVRTSLAASRKREADRRALLAPLGEVTLAERARVRQHLARSVAKTPRRPWRAVILAVGGLAVVAVAMLSRPAPLDARLDAEELRRDVLTDAVSVSYAGSGLVTGNEKAPTIAWDAGTLVVEVTPGAGVALAVETPEARVEVVGTVFTVTRDALGTTVSVSRGKVAVACVAGDQHMLTAGDEVECLPTRPAKLLGRARALAARGASSERVLATLDLAPSEPGVVDDEIAALRIQTLVGAGRDTEARAAADAVLARGGGVRRAEVARLAGQIALRTGGCVSALPYLRAIPESERQPDDTATLATCLETLR